MNRSRLVVPAVPIRRWALRTLLFPAALMLLLGSSCSSGVPSTPSGLPCSTDDDCPDGRCVAGLCEPDSPASGSTADADATGAGGESDATDPNASGDPERSGEPTQGPPGASSGTPSGEQPEPGAFGGACEQDVDCRDGGICLQGAEGGFCTRSCDGDCPEGYACRLLAGGGQDFVQFCIPLSPVLCTECDVDLDCGGLDDLCLDRLDGRYCATACDPTRTEPCPAGYLCQVVVREAADGEGVVERFQCIPELDVCGDCLDLDGDGYGFGPGCLGPDCDDSEPNINPGMPSICDGRDTNCAGVIDEGFDLDRDIFHCGACDNVCTVPFGAPACVDGVCEIASCDDGRADCDGLAETGCEVTLATDVLHCGACDNACDLPNADAACADGACVVARCLGTQRSCDGSNETGCETDINVSVAHCGACGNGCDLPNATPRCAGGVCEILTCDDGFANCNGAQEDGCEVSLQTDPLHCGTCGVICVGGQACQAGTCACPGDQVFFDGTCQAGVRPAVETDGADDLTTTGFRMNGTLATLGVPAIDRFGFCWSPGEAYDPDDDDADCTTLLFEGPPELQTFRHRLSEREPGSRWTYKAFSEVTGGERVTGESVTVTLQQAPAVATDGVATVTETAAAFTGSLSRVGVPAVAADDWGFCWGEMANPTVDLNLGCATVPTPGTSGTFSAAASGLVPGTAYNVRAFARNDVATVYGESLPFRTLQTPQVQTLAASAVTTTAATMNGRLTRAGTPPTDDFGFCYGTTPGIIPFGDGVTCPQAADPSPTGEFSITLGSDTLAEGQTYFYTAYARNSLGIQTGEVRSFTLLRLPRVDTLPIRPDDDLEQTSARLRGDLTQLGVPNPSEHGFCISTSDAFPPAPSDCNVLFGPATATGLFGRIVQNLAPGTGYHAWAFAENAAGRAYGDRIAFTTPQPPSVRTDQVVVLSETQARLEGTVTTVGVPAITVRGFCIATFGNPTVGLDNVDCPEVSGGPGGPYALDVDGLTPGRLYFARAYGRADTFVYGESLEFRMLQQSGVRTDAVSNRQPTSVTLNGTILDIGNPAPTDYGFCWGTSPDPDDSDTCHSFGTAPTTGSFQHNVTALDPSTPYHVRTFIRVNDAPVWGNNVAFASCDLTETPGADLTLDANCDGVPGADIARAVFVSTTGADSETCGTREAPCATIARGLDRAVDLDRDQVLVASGNYTGPAIAPVPGVGLYGGYSDTFDTRSEARSNFTSNGNVALVARGLDAPTIVDRINLETRTRTTAGASAFGVVVADSADHLTLRRVDIEVGRGGNGGEGDTGASGEAGATGAAGNNREGGAAANGGGAGGRGGSCTCILICFSCTDGSNGGTGSNSSATCGQAGQANGGGGGTGCPGAAGNPGSGGGSTGALALDAQGPIYSPVAGEQGSNGARGGGGGGGAGGEGGEAIFGGSDGSGGGAGGQGGAGGRGGTGGTGGGASVGIVLRNAELTLDRVTVSVDGGGDGGRGGIGGSGGAGGVGGVDGASSGGGFIPIGTPGRGGNGGQGGTGGTGGCGGGGGGGPTIGAWGIGSGDTVRTRQTTWALGLGGAGGPPGTGAVTCPESTRGTPGTRAEQLGVSVVAID